MKTKYIVYYSKVFALFIKFAKFWRKCILKGLKGRILADFYCVCYAWNDENLSVSGKSLKPRADEKDSFASSSPPRKNAGAWRLGALSMRLFACHCRAGQVLC